MKRVVAYCRTAWVNQSDPFAGVNLQANEIRRFAEGHGLAISETYMDAGVSGVTLERSELQRLLEDCQAGGIGTVLTQDRERLSRDKERLLALLHIFGSAGVQVEFTGGQGKR
jgi:site-specific DNA recombinase